MRFQDRARDWRAVVPALLLAGTMLLSTIPAASAPTGERGRDRSVTLDLAQPLRTFVFTDRREYLPGRPVLIEAGLINLGRPTSLANVPEPDILVREARTGRVVWQWSWRFTRQGVPPQLPPLPPRASFRLERREARSVYVRWDQTDGAGRPVPPGVYLIEAQVFPRAVVTPIMVLGAPPVAAPMPVR